MMNRILRRPPYERGIPFNLKTSAGKDLFIELVRQVDVVVENFSPWLLSGGDPGRGRYISVSWPYVDDVENAVDHPTPAGAYGRA
jgi:hypothetical protein